jgi:hypothetical protein
MYDCETGELRWSTNEEDLMEYKKSDRIRIRGQITGTRNGKRLVVQFKGKRVSVHRIAWLLCWEEWPKNEIDHIDGNPYNNRIANLRDVLHSENTKNCKMPSTNTSGVTGVHWNKINKKWVAQIDLEGETRHIGSFDTLEEAAAARRKANVKYGYHENHGAVR